MHTRLRHHHVILLHFDNFWDKKSIEIVARKRLYLVHMHAQCNINQQHLTPPPLKLKLIKRQTFSTTTVNHHPCMNNAHNQKKLALSHPKICLICHEHCVSFFHSDWHGCSYHPDTSLSEMLQSLSHSHHHYHCLRN